MAFRNRGFIHRAGSRVPRRATEWVASADSVATQLLAAASSVLDQTLSEASLADIVPATVIRVRGELFVGMDQSAASEQAFGALGMAVVSEQARVAGVASVPTPITDEGSDLWFVHQFWAAPVFVGTDASLLKWYRYSFDSKAMRKLEDGMSIVVVLENASATAGMQYLLKFRMLFKYH